MSHYYKKDGKPLYQINKIGSHELRDTHLGDARKLGLVPSVTTITSQLAKPQLNKWVIDQTLDAAIKFPYRANEEESIWKKRVAAITKEQTDKAAIRGTEIHDKLEQYFLKGVIDETDSRILVPALNLLSYEFNGQKWIPEASFAHKSGFGGKVDLYSKTGIIVDFKTKAKDEINEKSLYEDYCIQLAAYRQGLDMPRAKCYNLIISTTSPGTLYLHRWTEEELQRGLEIFNIQLKLWQVLNKYDSSWGDDNDD